MVVRLLLGLVFLSSLAAANSGDCAGCAIIVGLVERMAMRFNTDIKQTVQILCDDIAPNINFVRELCDVALDLFVPGLQKDYERGLSPDVSCKTTIPLCKNYPTCELYNVWPPSGSEHPFGSEKIPAEALRALGLSEEEGDGELTPLQILLHQPEYFNTLRLLLGPRVMKFKMMQSGVPFETEADIFHKLNQAKSKAKVGGMVPVEDHLPLIDFDGDRFSTIQTLRGTDWRGKDCDDFNADMYPGRLIDNVGPEKDHNCNGIFGVDKETGKSYEELFCQGTGQLGIIALGDSATAHFHIPPDWMDALTISNTSFSNVGIAAENELDWPQCSSSTAHYNVSYCPASDLPINSLYMLMRERNLCMHRDYQNVGVNGGSSWNMQPPNGIIISMKSRNVTDQPATVYFALIGNDVCGHEQDFSHMTTPAQFEANVLNSLDYLEANLQAGSHVVFVGLVDGRILYNTMHALIHPVGVTYTQVYDYLNCLDTSPCWGWMNSNETVRNMTSEIAATLSAVYPQIIASHNYTNFDMFYIDAATMMDTVVNEWIAQGHNASDLIEPVDGFHPSQTANVLIAQNLWQGVSQGFPQAMGGLNPNNEAIMQMFGYQGGY